MKNNRIIEHPILGNLTTNNKEVEFTFDGEKYIGFEQDTIASALLANGVRTLRVQEETGTPRGIYCNIGHCYECRLTVDQVTGVRACLTKIRPQMNIQSGQKKLAPLKPSTIREQLPRTYEELSKLKCRESKEEDRRV